MLKKDFSIISLGCFRNTYDSEIAARRFLDEGYVYKKDIGRGCDCLVINTCGFISDAKKESLAVIEEAVELKRRKKIKKIVVFGCLVQRYCKDLERFFPQVDQWLPVEEFSLKFKPRPKLLPPHIDFLKICEGCLNKCSYCAIPFIKGGLKSKPAQEVLREVEFLDKRGVKELNVIGQDITSWGKDLPGENDLSFLLEKIIAATKNIRWIRLIYTHPRHITDSLIDLIAREDKICNYIDLPIQHINDRILKLMKRGITKKQIFDLIKTIRKKIPGCVIRTSIITGFPSETEEEFNELTDFLRRIKFERLGVFVYSREEGTAAYAFKKQLHYRTKMKRYCEIMNLQKDIALEVNRGFIGKELEVLVEDKYKDMFIGRSRFDAYEVDGAVFIKNKNLRPGDFYRARITDAYEYDLAGE